MLSKLTILVTASFALLAIANPFPKLPPTAVNDGALGSSATIVSGSPTPSATGSTMCAQEDSEAMCCDAVTQEEYLHYAIRTGCNPLDATMKCAKTTTCCFLPQVPSETPPKELVCYTPGTSPV